MTKNRYTREQVGLVNGRVSRQATDMYFEHRAAELERVRKDAHVARVRKGLTAFVSHEDLAMVLWGAARTIDRNPKYHTGEDNSCPLGDRVTEAARVLVRLLGEDLTDVTTAASDVLREAELDAVRAQDSADAWKWRGHSHYMENRDTHFELARMIMEREGTPYFDGSGVTTE